MRKLLNYIIIVAIFGITIYLVFKILGPAPSDVIEKTSISNVESNIERSEEWLGIFIQGQRIGYSFTKINKSDTGLEVENRSQMTLNIMGEMRSLSTHLFAHTDKDYTLKDFSLDLTTTGHPTRVEGRIDGLQLELTSYSQGTSHTQLIELKEKPYFPDAIEEVIKSKNMKPGDEISIPYFDPTTQASAFATIKMFEKEKVMVFEKELIGTKIELNYMGITSFLWLDDNYRMIKESSPAMGLEMIPLSKEMALAEIKPSDAFDLLSFFSVKLNKTITGLRNISYLKLELEDITTEDLDLTDDYQMLISERPITIECYRADIDNLPNLDLPIREHQEFLESSAYIQCNNPDIIAKANEFVDNEKDAKKAAGKLVKGVYNLLEKKPTASLPSAIDVLKTREGDCNEHSILFTALARAAGIPTKIYVGLINLNGSAYFYHAWCAVWLGKWVPVDPTFNQYPADVGHLKLKEGELSEQAKVLKVVGRLKIDVLEYSKD